MWNATSRVRIAALLWVLVPLTFTSFAVAQGGNAVAEARSEFQAGNLDAAAARLETYLESEPSSGEAQRVLARVREAQGRTDDARAARRKAYDLGDREAALLRTLGRDLLTGRAFGLAARVLEEADALEPLPLGARRGLAMALAQAERYEAAVQQLSVLLAMVPEDAALRTARARAEAVQGHEKAALADLDVLVGSSPQDVELQLLRGKVLAKMGRFEQAIESFETVLSLQPSPDAQSIAQADIGSARGQMGDVQAAEKAYREALQTDPGNVIAAANLADILADREATEEEAEHILRAAINRTPEASLLYYQLGKTLLSRGRVQEAEDNLRLAVRKNPSNPRYHYQYALALHRAGKTEEAEREMGLHEDLLQRYRERSGKE